MAILLRKFKSLVYYIGLYIERLAQKLRIFWVNIHVFFLRYSNYQVFIGPFFANLGGVSHHIQSINKFTKLKSCTIPSEALLKFLQKNKCVEYYKSNFETINFANRILHSHVDPWYIKVCERPQSQGNKWTHTYHTLYFDRDWDEGL